MKKPIPGETGFSSKCGISILLKIITGHKDPGQLFHKITGWGFQNLPAFVLWIPGYPPMQDSSSNINPLKVAAPGRINLLGEHTDYNEGFVLPATIQQQISFTFEKNGTPNRCRITSTSLGKAMRADLDHLRPTLGWENYISGVLAELLKHSEKLQGFDVDFTSDIPPGAGLSSSAALECGLAFGLNSLFELGLSPLELIRLSQEAEHHFVGTQCGIMDQFACVMGRKNHFILLDCRDLHHRYIPADLGDCLYCWWAAG